MRTTRSTALLLSSMLLLAGGCSLGGTERVTVTLLGTTDFHGDLMPWDYPGAAPDEGSLAQLATQVGRIRAEEEAVVLVDSGDFLQGSELTDYMAERGIDGVHPVIAAMNVMGYDAVAMGNHEYNHGLPFLERALEDAEFPVLSANIYLEDADELAYRPYVIVERAGVRVGILGLTTPGIAIWDRDHVQGRLRFEDMVESARRWLPELLAQEPDLVVVAAHSGVDEPTTYSAASGVPEENAVARLARELPEIDVVFAGHTAGPEEGRRIGTATVIHAGHSARTLAAVRVVLERDGEGAWQVSETSSELLDVEGLPADPELVAAVETAHEETVSWLEDPIGTTPDVWSAAEARVRDTPVGDLILTVMERAAGAQMASTPILDPGISFGPGEITRRDILALYRYPNTLRAVRVTGADLRAYLEQTARYFRTWPAEELVNEDFLAFNYDVLSGLHYRIDLSWPVGERIHSLTFAGRPVRPDDTFVLAVNNYRQTGGGGFEMIATAPRVDSRETLVSTLIIEFIRDRGVLRHEDVHRENWSLGPEPARLRLLASEATLSRY